MAVNQRTFLAIAQLAPDSPCLNTFGRLFRSSGKLQRVCSGSTARCRCVGLTAGQWSIYGINQ